ncbi:MAG: hypothetical protein DRI44_08385 [Chlamydiae bacterium]|nr:MAG: hypothetical protein DRI44_08385 [Chlamydiota bacterium]
MDNSLLNKYEVGQSVEIIGVVESVRTGTTKKGDPYVELMLTAKNERCRCIWWDKDNVEDLAHKPVKVQGTIKLYRDARNLWIDNIQVIRPTPEIMRQLVPSANSTEIEKLKKKLWSMIKTYVTTQPLRQLLVATFKRYLPDMANSPAASKIHDAYLGGLLRHTVAVASLAIQIAKEYPHLVNMELLITGALLHDIGKVFAYQVDNLVIERSQDGILLEHIVMGLEIVNKIISEHKIKIDEETLKLIKHIIISHHGQLEWGSPVKPAIPEAIIVHYADVIDSRLSIVEHELSDMKAGEIKFNKYVGYVLKVNEDSVE